MSEKTIDTAAWKNKIALLWLCGPVLELARIMMRDDPIDTLGSIFVHSTFYLVLGVAMAFLTLVLKDDLNRKINIVVGIWPALGFYIIGFLEFSLEILPIEGSRAPAGLEDIIINALKCIITACIPWLAWKWPRQKAEKTA